MRQVKFSILCWWGKVAFVRAYIFQTWVAKGSFLARASGSVPVSPGSCRSGNPDMTGEVNGLVSRRERGGSTRRSSAKIFEKMADLESTVGEPVAGRPETDKPEGLVSGSAE
jgi:hypothetical protein